MEVLACSLAVRRQVGGGAETACPQLTNVAEAQRQKFVSRGLAGEASRVAPYRGS